MRYGLAGASDAVTVVTGLDVAADPDVAAALAEFLTTRRRTVPALLDDIATLTESLPAAASTESVYGS